MNILSTNNEISIIYKIKKNEDRIKLFGAEFIKNNKNKCKFIYRNKEYDLWLFKS